MCGCSFERRHVCDSCRRHPVTLTGWKARAVSAEASYIGCVLAGEASGHRPAGPDPRDVEALTDLLDLMRDFPSNEQRARYLLTCDWMRERGAAVAEQSAADLAELRSR